MNLLIREMIRPKGGMESFVSHRTPHCLSIEQVRVILAEYCHDNQGLVHVRLGDLEGSPNFVLARLEEEEVLQEA